MGKESSPMVPHHHHRSAEEEEDGSEASAQTTAAPLTPRSTASSSSAAIAANKKGKKGEQKDHWEQASNSTPKRSRLNTEREDLLRGLQASPKTIPCSFLYDEAGSALYDQITELEEYYPYREEERLLERHAADIVQSLEPGAVLVELGCGSATKTGILLREALKRFGPDSTRFVGIDISSDFLSNARTNLLDACPGLKAGNVETVCAPYLEGLAEARRRHPRAVLCVLWLGSSVGNLDPSQAEGFFRAVLDLCGQRTQVFFCADLWKDAAVLRAAYHDARGVTEAFIRNGLAHALRQLPGSCRQLLDSLPQLPGSCQRSGVGHRPAAAEAAPATAATAWRYEVDVNPELQQVEMWLRSTCAQQLGEDVAVEAGERVLIEVSRKFTPARLRRLVFRAGFCAQAAWSSPLYAMQLVASPLVALEATWRATDALFAFPQGVGGWDCHPIDLRHPFCFYYGHLPAFAKPRLLPQEPLSEWDELFGRGIDPDVEDPSHCHAHPAPPPKWPTRRELTAYVEQTRAAFRRAALGGRIPHRALLMALEHERMHVETLDYMLAQERKRSFTAEQAQLHAGRVKGRPQPVLPSSPAEEAVQIPQGTVSLGVDVAPEDGFVWDNEQPQQAPVGVAAFGVAPQPVTVGQFWAWAVRERGYERPEFWAPGELEHFQSHGHRLPATWSQAADGEVFVHLPHGSFHWAEVAERPVYCCATEAAAFCRSRGAGLLTEAQYHRILAHDPPGERVHALRSGGWEHTQTTFAPLEGFTPEPSYPEYSTDFFDGKHNVLLGSSPSTHPSLLRDSFRNFYQRSYPYVFAKFRCCYPAREEE